MVKVNCKICGKLFETYPSRIKIGKGSFCSKKCAYKRKKSPHEYEAMLKRSKEKILSGENHPSWRGGKPNCKQCGKTLKSYKSKLCKECLSLPHNNPAYKGGKPYCIDCGVRLTHYKEGKCKKCFHKTYRGEKTYNWKGGKPKCRECGIQLKNFYAEYCNRHANLGERNYKWIPRLKCNGCGKTLDRNARYRKSGFCKKCVFKGERSIHWRGGITPINFKIRNSLQYKEWRANVFKRDNWTCINCGYKGKKIQADHIKPFSKYPELRFDINNGRTFCMPCHLSIGWKNKKNERGRAWRKGQTSQVEEIFIICKDSIDERIKKIVDKKKKEELKLTKKELLSLVV